jgi:hypothetical protein
MYSAVHYVRAGAVKKLVFGWPENLQFVNGSCSEEEIFLTLAILMEAVNKSKLIVTHPAFRKDCDSCGNTCHMLLLALD